MKPIVILFSSALLVLGVAVAEEPTTTSAPTLGPPVVAEEPAKEESKEEKVLEERYVTDKLVLGMKDNPEGTGKSIKLLRSGMKLEVLEKRGAYNRVRTEEGLIGWAKSNFMVKDKPAILIVSEMEKENKALRKEIDKLKKNGTTNQTSKPESKSESTEKPLEDESVKQRLMEIETALTEARKQLKEKEAQLEAVEDSMPVGESSGISFTAILIALLLGLGIGGVLMYIYFDNRISQRFAGMKV